MLRRYLTLWLVLSSGVAFWWPWMWDAVGSPGGAIDPFVDWQQSIAVAVVITMFCIGALLPPDEVRQVARRWPAVLFGTAVQFTAMPFLAWAAATLWGLTGDVRVGVLLVGCVPGAMASNVLTLAARGNVSYSIGLTTTATIASPIVVPLALKLTGGGAVSNEALVRISLELLWMVVAPVLAGFALCRWSPRFERLMGRVGETAANLAILWIIAAVVGRQRQLLSDAAGAELLATLATLLLCVNLLGYAAGYFSAVLIKLPEGMRRALTIEVGMQNAGVGTQLAIAILGGASAATVPTALYTFGCMLTGTLLAQWFGRKACVEAAAGESPEIERLVMKSEAAGVQSTGTQP